MTVEYKNSKPVFEQAVDMLRGEFAEWIIKNRHKGDKVEIESRFDGGVTFHVCDRTGFPRATLQVALKVGED